MSDHSPSKTLCVLAALMLGGCGGLNESQVDAGRAVCANHGGVKWHWVSFRNTDLDVWCKDGTKITAELKS